MAGVLEQVLAREISCENVIDWLLGIGNEEGSRSLSELGDVKEDFVPFLLNFLRDQTLHLIQGCRSTTTTPAKTPSSLLRLKKKPSSTPAHQVNKSKRIQLFSGPSESKPLLKTTASGNDTSSQTRDYADSFTSRPGWGKHTGEMRGGNRPNKSPQSHSTPPDNGRYRNKQSLGDFFHTPDNEQGQKKSPLGTIKDDRTPSPHSGRRSGNRKGHSSEKKSKQNSRQQEQAPPVFCADDFPPVGMSSAGRKVSPGLPSGAQIITSSRRVPTTLISPQNTNKSKDNSIFKLARELSAPSPRSAWLSPVDSRNDPRSLPLSLVSPPPGMILQGGLQSIPEIGRSPSSPWSRPLVDRSTSKAVRRVELNTLSPSQGDDTYDSPVFKRVPEIEKPTPAEAATVTGFKTPQKTVTISEPDNVTPIKTYCVTPGKGESFTPTKSLLERLLSCEVLQADRANVTHQGELDLIAALYSACMQKNLPPNITVELYFLTQLLTARGSEIETPIDLGQDLDEIQYFSSIHNAVYFAVTVLAQQKRLVSLLDRGTLRLLADNQRVADFLPSFKEELNVMYENTSIKASLGVSYPSPVGGVSFQADTDNKKNFPSERCFHMFKKQRDGFYELLREWEENHLIGGWSMVELQGEKVRRLVGFRTELANHVHFSRLFLTQLIQMSKGDQSVLSEGDDEANISLLSELKLTNPDKLKRLQERFTTPSSVGGPCPPPSFPGCQEFFRDFIVAASSHVFNQHLLDSMTSKIADLNATPFSSPDANDEEIVDAEDKEALVSCLLDLKLIGKFLGYVTFLPYQSPEALPESMSSSFMTMRNQTAQSMDVLLYLKTAQLEGRVVLTLPWVVDYLTMMDAVAPKLDYFQLVFILLIEIYRQAGRLLSLRGRHTQLLTVATLGWLFELPIFPAGLFFKDHPYLSDTDVIESLPKGCVDLMDIVDQQILFTCCPYLGEMRSLLVDFAVGMSSRNHSVRKITPVSTKPLATSSVSEKQLQHQMEDNFFHNHPASLKRTVEFVADRVASNQIKQFRAKMFPQMLEEGYEKARALAAPLLGKSPDSRTKRKTTEQLDKLASHLSQKSKNANLAAGKGYCEEKAQTILPLLLPEEVSTQVLKMCTHISVRIAQEKINNWLNTHITTAMYKREVASEFEKQLRAQSLLDKSLPMNKTTRNVRTEVPVSAPCPECPNDCQKGPCDCQKGPDHCQDIPSPSEGVLLLKDLLRDFLTESHNHTSDDICKVLTSVSHMLQYRDDILPMVKKSLSKMTTDLCYMLVLDYPKLWSTEVEGILNRIWQIQLKEFMSFNHLICPKHLCLLDATPQRQVCEERLVSLAVRVLKLGLTDIVGITSGCEAALQDSPAKEDVTFLATFLQKVASACPVLNVTDEDLKSVNKCMDLLSAYAVDCRVSELIQRTQRLVLQFESSLELDPRTEGLVSAEGSHPCDLTDKKRIEWTNRPESFGAVVQHCDNLNDNLTGPSQVGVVEILSNLPVMPTSDNRMSVKGAVKPQPSSANSPVSAKENLSR